MRSAFQILSRLLLLCLLCAQPIQAQTGSGTERELPVEPASVFQLPLYRGKYVELQQTFSKALAEGRREEAKAELGKALQLAPLDAISLYNQACMRAVDGDLEGALASLNKAIECGLYSADLIAEDKDLEALKEDPRFKEALQRAALKQLQNQLPFQQLVKQAEPSGGVVMISEDNVAYDFRTGVFLSFFDLDEPQSNSPVLSDDNREEAKLLHRWYRRGKAAGNVGDLYDNRDKDHSNLAFSKFPQLARIEYSEAAKVMNLHQGLQTQFMINAVTLGNSSTAYTQGQLWRSLPRRAYTSPQLANGLYAQYTRNQLYFYPEHQDHDPAKGDVFPANTPYVLISQGSSGSDQVFMEAFVQALAALKPEVKAKLKSSGALMPTLQMLFRYSNRNVLARETYLSGVAHPPVFDAENLEPLRFLKMAQDLEVDNLPPLVRMQILEEDQFKSATDFFGSGHERIFDTPSAIARIHRTKHFMRRMVVSTENSLDLQGKPLKYHWKLLSGNPGLVRITQLNPSFSRAEIEVAYHVDRFEHPGSGLLSSRVDIGVFADNGSMLSAPGFITIYFPPNIHREYVQGRVSVIDYGDEKAGQLYGDPILTPIRDWRDEYHYDEASGEVSGWTRTYKSGATEDFTPEGFLISETDASGEPAQVKGVLYEVAHPPDSVPTLRVHYSKESKAYSEILQEMKSGR